MVAHDCVWAASTADVSAWKAARLDAPRLAAHQPHLKRTTAAMRPKRHRGRKEAQEASITGQELGAQCLCWLLQALLSRPRDSSTGRIAGSLPSFGAVSRTPATTISSSRPCLRSATGSSPWTAGSLHRPCTRPMAMAMAMEEPAIRATSRCTPRAWKSRISGIRRITPPSCRRTRHGSQDSPRAGGVCRGLRIHQRPCLSRQCRCSCRGRV
jgi:hypothetical protein